MGTYRDYDRLAALFITLYYYLSLYQTHALGHMNEDRLLR